MHVYGNDVRIRRRIRRRRERTCSSIQLHRFLVLITLSQGLTIGIAEGGPCGRTGERARGDGGAGWFLQSLLNTADQTTRTAPGYAPRC